MQNYQYGKEPSDQMALAGIGLSGETIMNRAKDWITENPDHFERYIRLARFQVQKSKDGKASTNGVKEWLRTGLDVNWSFPGGALTFAPHRRVSIPNAISPALARIAMEMDETLNFHLAASKTDGYTEVVFGERR